MTMTSYHHQSSLKWRIYNYIKGRGGWIHKGDIETQAKIAGYLGETAGRELRLLNAEGAIISRKVGKSLEYSLNHDIN